MAAITTAVIGIGSAVAGAVASNRQASAASRAADSQSAIAQQQLDLANKQWDNWEQTYKPLEQQLAADAAGYDTMARRETNAERAMASQQQATDAAQRNLGNTLNERGVNPASGAYQAGMRDIAIRGAANTANAGTQSRLDTEATGFARRAAVAGIGRNIPGSVQAGLASAGNMAGQAANTNMMGAQNTANGIANFGSVLGKGVSGFMDWWKQPSSGGGYNPGNYTPWESDFQG